MGQADSSKVLLIGLDCAAPQFIFGPDAFDLPNIQELMRQGCWGALRSCDPPITVPAWSCMTSSKDPGTLGIYGFRNRADHSYDAQRIATSTAVHEKRIWDILGEHDKQSILLGVPQTYPIKPMHGHTVSGLLTPGTDAQYTHPESLAVELEESLGEYIIDVADFRTEDKDALLARIYALMNNRFDAAHYLMKEKPWDFFMLVEMGVDRLHHAFWHYCDPTHPNFERNNPYIDVLKNYYQAVDSRIGQLIQDAGSGCTTIIVSDHGAKPLHGGIRINQWLINNGYLTLKEPASNPTAFSPDSVDWSRTRAWGEGGYYGRIYLNVQGREPDGIVKPEEYDTLRDTLIDAIGAMIGPTGEKLENRVLKPEEIYATVNGVAPDLIAYFGELHWRSIGMVGCENIFATENDTGPDEANHDFEGVFVAGYKDRNIRGEKKNLSLLDIAPTILELLGVETPSDLQGNSLLDL